MARRAGLHRRSGRLAALACGAAGVALALAATGGLGFAAPAGAAPGGGLNRKQAKANLHTRANLPPVLEVPLDEPEAEAPPKEPMPERRVPYTMHIISSFPNNKHLHEESNARKFIQDKIVNSLENMEDLIKHLEVNLQVSEGFHRELRDKPKKMTPAVVQAPDEDEGLVTEGEVKEGAKLLAPYIFKVTVSLHNHRTIVFANAEKHAQPTLTEGIDHMVDVLKKSLREEKDRMIKARKKQKDTGDEEVLSSQIDSLRESEQEIEDLTEEIEAEKDRQAEEIYRRVEAASD